MTRFSSFTEPEIGEIARALLAAANEGERPSMPLVQELANEFDQRGLRVPLPYKWGYAAPVAWGREVELA